MNLTYTQKELNSVLDQILNLMKTEGTNWVKGWSSKIASGFPVNAKTKKKLSRYESSYFVFGCLQRRLHFK